MSLVKGKIVGRIRLSLLCTEDIEDLTWERVKDADPFILNKRKKRSETSYIRKRGLLNPFPALCYYTKHRSGTFREKNCGGKIMLTENGVCECGWSQNIDNVNRGKRDWCTICTKRVWSICLSDKRHSCPSCNEIL